jgi:hypothetical protein
MRQNYDFLENVAGNFGKIKGIAFATFNKRGLKIAQEMIAW